MLRRSGELFHIDFRHFLGNFKYKYGVKKERSPFVFTPAFAAVLGGESGALYKEFQLLCVQAFHVLRNNSALLMCLFSLMLGSGFPELTQIEDIFYLRDNLMTNETDDVAGQRFLELISQCLHTRSNQYNSAIRLLAQE